MRSLFIAVLILSWLPMVLFKPHIGVLLWDWVSHMNPHRYTYGFAYNFPFLNFVAAATLVGVVLSRDRIKLSPHPILFILIAFYLWMVFTTVASFDWALSFEKLGHISKVLLFALISVVVMRSPNRLRAFVIIMALSLAFVAVKGGLFTLVTGATGRVQGAGGMIDDNNQLAMALAMMIPLSVWFIKYPPLPWLKWPLVGVAVCFVVAALGTQSRGGLVALAAVLGMMWLKSRKKLLSLALVVPLALTMLVFLPDNWRDRMSTIETATEDNSFLGRVSMWKFAVNLTDEHPIEGGGFRAHEMPRAVELYMPVGYPPRAPHSNYFEVLGEHGYVGLLLFLATLFTGWFSGEQSAKRFRQYRETVWLGDLAESIQLGLIGFAVGGLTVNISTFDLYYHFLAVLMMIDVVGNRRIEKGVTRMADIAAAAEAKAATKKRFVPTGHVPHVSEV